MIYHLARQQDWAQAQAAGMYHTASLEAEGFIHASSAEQVLRVANQFYHGANDLVLLVIDPARLAAPLRFEPPVHPGTRAADTRSAERFPHIYGPLNLDAVVQFAVIAPGADGRFTWPTGIRQEE